MAEIFIGNSVLIPYSANWKERPKVRLRAKTQSRTNAIGEEARTSAWATLRREQEWMLTGTSGEASARIEATLKAAQVAKSAACPYFVAQLRATAVSGQVVTLDRIPEWAAPGQLIWWSTSRSGAYGVATVTAVAGASLTLATVPEGMARGVFVAPILVGVLVDNPEVDEIDGAARSWKVTLAQTMGDLAGSRRDGAEAATLGIGVSGALIERAPNRIVGDAGVLAVSVSGSLVTVVVSRSSAEAAALGIVPSGILKVIAINRDGPEAAVMGISITGTLV